MRTHTLAHVHTHTHTHTHTQHTGPLGGWPVIHLLLLAQHQGCAEGCAEGGV